MNRRRQQGRRSQQGFTLIELLVACTLMAVLAVLSWRGLDSVLQSRERLNVASDELRSLTLALSQLEEDLLRSWTVRQMGLEQPALMVLQNGERGGQSLAVIREVNRSGMPTRIQRVVYEVRDNLLVRGFGEFATGAGGTGFGGGVGGAVQSLVWQPLLGSVRAIHLRGWVDGRGWLDPASLGAVTVQEQALNKAAAAAGGAGGTPPGGGGTPSGGTGTPQPAAPATDIPSVVGIELIVERLDGQRFQRVYSVRD